jgi:hypothetical protein
LKELHVFHLLTKDTVFPHSGTKSAGVQTKKYRCPGWPLYAPPGFAEHLEDVVMFNPGKGFDLLT